MIQDRKPAVSAFDSTTHETQLAGAHPAAGPELHGNGGANAEAAAVQSHWAEGAGGHGADEVAALKPNSDHAELAKALDEPDHEGAATHAAAAVVAAPHAAATVSAAPQAHAEAAADSVTIGDTASHKRGFTDGVYKENLANAKKSKVDITSSGMKGDLALFKSNYIKNSGRYESVASQTGVPAKLVAAIHWREASGNFKTYLHNGDPLGKPTTHVPKGVLFYSWEPAAVDAINGKASVKNDLGMTSKTTDLAAMGTYAEFYNGTGYYNKGRVSPYVFSGTNVYKSGKYVADGVYDPNAKDAQLGVDAMLQSLDGVKTSGGGGGGGGGGTPAPQPPAHTAESTLKQGSKGAAVVMLQQKLAKAGEHVSADGDFGPGTLAAVKDFQGKHGLGADGVVGPQTWAALDKVAGNA